MENQKYAPDSLISTYIVNCQSVDQPLNKYQVGVLEQTLLDYFDLTNNKHTLESIGLEETGQKPFDTVVLKQVSDVIRYGLPGNLIYAVKQYKYGSADNTLDITDADAINLYSFTVREMQHRNFSDIKKKSEIPHCFGRKAFKALHYYLQLKGYIDRSEDLPREPKFRTLEPSPYLESQKEAVFKLIE